MSDLSLTASRLPAAPSAISAVAITATVPDPPRNFAALDNGTILRGTVQGRDKDGLIAVKTDQGILKIATNVNLQPGSHVTMEVRSVGDRLQVVLLAVDQAAAAAPAAAELLAGAGPANAREASGAPQSASAGGQAAGAAPALDHAERPAAGAATHETAPPTVIVAGTRLTAIVIQSVPRELIQGSAQSLQPAAVEPQLATRPGSSAENRPAEQVAAFTAEFRPTPPPPISASLLPEIHDRIAALFTEPAEASAPTAEGALPSSLGSTAPAGPGGQIGPLTLNPEIRERIVSLFVGSPSEPPAPTVTSPAPPAQAAAPLPAATTPPLGTIPPGAVSPGAVPPGTTFSGSTPSGPAPAGPIVSAAAQPSAEPGNEASPETSTRLSPSSSLPASPIPAGTLTAVAQTQEQASPPEAPSSPLPPARAPAGQVAPLPVASPPLPTPQAPSGQVPVQQTASPPASSPLPAPVTPPPVTTGAPPSGAAAPTPSSPAVAPNSAAVPLPQPAAASPAAAVPLAMGETAAPAGQSLPPAAQSLPTPAPNIPGGVPLPPAAAASTPNPTYSVGGVAIPLDPAGGEAVTILPVTTAPASSVPEANPIGIPPGGTPVSTTPPPIPTTAPLVIPALVLGLAEAGQDGVPPSLPGAPFPSLPANPGQASQDPLVSPSPVSPPLVTPPLPTAPVQITPSQTGPGQASSGGIGNQTPAAAQPGDARTTSATGPAGAAADIVDTAGPATTLNAVVSSAGKVPLGWSTAPVLAGSAQAAAQAEYQTISTLGEAASAASELTGKQLPSGPLPTGTELRLRVLNIQQPALGGGQAASVQLAGTAGGKPTVVGQILGHTPAGHPVIHSSLGDLVLQQQATLPVGATITLAVEAMDMASAASAIAIPVTPQMTAWNMAQGWPTLLDLLVTLQHGATSAAGGDPADPAVIAHLAQPGSKLAASMNAAMDAFRAGDFEKLFGALGSTLKSGGGKQETVRKLRDEFTQLSMLAQDRPQQDWRCFFLPLWDDGRLQQINLFYRRQRRGQSGDKDKGDDATRFVVEVNFTRLGGCQLDGLIRKKHFDLMIRSHQELPLAIKRDLAGLFAQARELGNYAGDISFQTTARFPVAPLDDIAKDAPSVTA